MEVFGPRDALSQFFDATPLPVDPVLPGLNQTPEAIFSVLDTP